MTDYVILQPVHLGSGPVGEARRSALEKWASEENCFWNNEPSIGRLIKKLADERRNMMAYYCTGTNGSVIQLEDGRFADTVSGDTSEGSEAHEALEFLTNEATGSEWVTSPLDGDFNQAQMQNYCGNHAAS